MNAHCIKPQYAADFGLFSAKFIAFWCKMEGVLVLNARQNGAKCKAIKHKNTLKWYKQNPFEA